MKIFSMKKTLLSLFLIAGVSFNSNAIEIGIGARLGGELNVNRELMKTNKGTWYDNTDIGEGIKQRNIGGAFTMGIFGDIWINDFFGVTPQFNMSLFRTTATKWEILGVKTESGLKSMAFDIDVLAKFRFLDMFYAGIGPGLSIMTTPKNTLKINGSKGDVSSEGNKGHLGVNLVLDFGAYIPLMGSDNHHIMVGLRNTLDFMSLFAKGMKDATVEDFDGITEMKPSLGTPFAVGLTVGYMYKF